MEHKTESNFKLLRTGIDTTPYLEELRIFLESGGAWGTHRCRVLPMQQHTHDITLRRTLAKKKETMGLSTEETVHYLGSLTDHQLDIVNYPFFKKTYAFLENFADEIGGQLVRATIVLLKPRKQVYAHIDQSSFLRDKDRYHLVLKAKRSVNVCGGETKIYKEGEVWWFDNKKLHEAHNDSDEDRIHVIFDVLPEPRSLRRKARDFFEKKASIAHAGLVVNTVHK